MRSEVQSFDGLVAAIARAHAALAAQASQAVNISLTLSNWLIGCYIQDYEQAGADRAVYGAQLLDKVSARLAQAGMGGVAARSLRQYRQFYLAYPQIWQTPSAESLQALIPAGGAVVSSYGPQLRGKARKVALRQRAVRALGARATE